MMVSIPEESVAVTFVSIKLWLYMLFVVGVGVTNVTVGADRSIVNVTCVWFVFPAVSFAQTVIVCCPSLNSRYTCPLYISLAVPLKNHTLSKCRSVVDMLISLVVVP